MRKKRAQSQTANDWKKLKEVLRQRTSISSAELQRLVKEHTDVAVDYAIWRLLQEGLLARRVRGLYVISEAGKDEAFLKDPIEAIHTLLGREVVFGYGTALYVHGLSRYGRITEYHLISTADKKPINLGDFVVRFIENPIQNEIGIIKLKFGRSTILLTDLERTLIDCVHRSKYAQGWENVVHAFQRAESVNGRRLIGYLKLYGLPSLVARVGPLLEHSAKSWNLRPAELDSLLEYLPGEPVRFDRRLRGKFNKKWNIFVPEGLFGE